MACRNLSLAELDELVERFSACIVDAMEATMTQANESHPGGDQNAYRGK